MVFVCVEFQGSFGFILRIKFLDIKSRWYFKRNNLIIYFKNQYVFKMTLLRKIFAIISKTDFLDLYLLCLSCKVSKASAYSLQPMQTTNNHTGYTVQSSNDPSFRKSLAPKHENGGLECPSSLTESTAQASCLAVMRFGDYNSNDCGHHHYYDSRQTSSQPGSYINRMVTT